jgi:ribonuclease HII
VTPPPVDLLARERPLLERGEVVVGIDEVGRGALAGPLVVGAVALAGVACAPRGLADSKALTPARRESLVAPIQEWAAAWSIGSASASEIDEWGLRLALAVAATRALELLGVAPTHALIDGSFNLLRAPGPPLAAAAPALRYGDLACSVVVRADQSCASVAAASVLAKVWRDRVMVGLDGHFAGYGWARNKGYGAPEHLAALRRLGTTVHHRRTWNLPDQDHVLTASPLATVRAPGGLGAEE